MSNAEHRRLGTSLATPDFGPSSLYPEMRSITCGLFHRVTTLARVLARGFAGAGGLTAAFVSGCWLQLDLPRAAGTSVFAGMVAALLVPGNRRSPLREIAPFHYQLAKRTMDLAMASMLLVLLAPILMLVAFIVRMDSAGPALFVQKRIGRDGKLFSMYKFRSMQTSAPRYGLSPTTSSDPRITRVGRFLRQTSLDELPQLFNVVLGTMSFVGPRPEMPFIVRRYDRRQLQRLRVTPGITGPWQLSDARRLPIHDNIHYDIWYIQNRSFFVDLAILIYTVFALRRGT